jgi:hypothetical protein
VVYIGRQAYILGLEMSQALTAHYLVAVVVVVSPSPQEVDIADPSSSHCYQMYPQEATVVLGLAVILRCLRLMRYC